MTNEDGDNMEVYDYVAADTLGDEENEQIVHENDYIEVTHVVKDEMAVMVKGYSHVTGDDVTYLIHPDVMVGLWMV